MLKTQAWTAWQYRASIAEGKAQVAGKASHQGWRMAIERLLLYVGDSLRRGWTPESISGRLGVDYPDDHAMQVCPETLYQWSYSKA